MARRKSGSTGQAAEAPDAKAPAAKPVPRKTRKPRAAAKAKEGEPAKAQAKSAPAPAGAEREAAPAAKPEAAPARAELDPAALDDSLLLPHTLEIGGIREFHQECVRLADRDPAKVILDGRDIAFIDTAGVQLLVSLVRSLQDRGCDVGWENFSVQVYQVAAELGLENDIGC